MKIDCNKCGKEFEFEPKQRQYNENVREIGLKCPHCGEWFHSYFLTPKLLKMQERLKKNRKRGKIRAYAKEFAKVQSELRKRYSIEPMKLGKKEDEGKEAAT